MEALLRRLVDSELLHAEPGRGERGGLGGRRRASAERRRGRADPGKELRGPPLLRVSRRGALHLPHRPRRHGLPPGHLRGLPRGRRAGHGPGRPRHEGRPGGRDLRAPGPRRGRTSRPASRCAESWWATRRWARPSRSRSPSRRFAAPAAALGLESGRSRDLIVTRRKGIASLDARAHGVAAHAGGDHEKGRNAIWSLARFVDRVAVPHRLRPWRHRQRRARSRAGRRATPFRRRPAARSTCGSSPRRRRGGPGAHRRRGPRGGGGGDAHRGRAPWQPSGAGADRRLGGARRRATGSASERPAWARERRRSPAAARTPR